MTPEGFTPQLPEVPAPTFEIPTPDIPRADFKLIQQQKREGDKESKIYQWLLDLIKDWIPTIVGKIIGSLLGLVEIVAAWLLRIFFRVFRSAEFGSDEIAAQVVSGLFGVDVASATFKNLGDHGARLPVARNMIEAIMTSMGGSFSGGTHEASVPTSEPAEKMLSVILHMTIDGWAQGLLMELISLGQIHAVGELREAVEQSLGLGRMSRRAFQPAVKAFVVDPFTKLINQNMRPTGLSAEVDIRQFLRGLITRGQLDTEMGYKGYTPERVEALLNYNRAHLSPAELIEATNFGLMGDQSFEDAMKAQGYDSDTALTKFNIEIAKQNNAAALELARYAVGQFRQGHLTVEALNGYINSDALSFGQKRNLVALAQFEKDHPQTKLSLQQGVQMVEAGIWTISQFRDLAASHRYAANDVDDLELLLLHKVADAADAVNRRQDQAKAKADAEKARIEKAKAAAARALAEVEVHGVSIARYETLVMDGIKTVSEYQTFLVGKGLSPGNVAAFVAHLSNRLSAAAAKAGAGAGAAATAKAKGLSVAQLEKAVKAGALSMGEYESRLAHVGLTPEDVSILVEVLTEELAAAKVKADAAAAAKAAAKVKGVNLAQEELAARQGLVSVDQFRAWLTSHGWADPDLSLIVAELQAKIAADAAARALKAGGAGTPAARGLGLAQLERAVRRGVSPMSDYTLALAKAGYDADAQTALQSLLQLQIDQDAHTAALRGQADGLLSPRGLTLPDIERAVKAKVLPMGAYTDALARAGVSADAIQTLSLVLAASIKNVTPPAATVKSVSALLTAAGLSLSSLEGDVLAERLPLSAFGTILSGAGVPASQVAQLEGVMQLRLDQRKAAAALAADAGKKAVAKQLSLGQEVAAIRASVQGLPDYQTLAGKLGYDPAAVQILVATLAADPKLFPPPPVV